MRADNQARIRWQGSSPHVTEYSFVYLHGFAGSYRDGYPLNVNVADAFGANLFLARWAGHGLLPSDALRGFYAEAAWRSAKEALAIGRRIGRKVIILSTSTGGTLAMKLAATYPDSVFALVNISPNVRDEQFGASLLNTPWGHEIAHAISLGKHRHISHSEPLAAQYWDTIYPAEDLVNLQVLVETTMNEETFTNITCPVLTVYYHKSFGKKTSALRLMSTPGCTKRWAHPIHCTHWWRLVNPALILSEARSSRKIISRHSRKSLIFANNGWTWRWRRTPPPPPSRRPSRTFMAIAG